MATVAMIGCVSKTLDSAPDGPSTPYTPEFAVLDEGKVVVLKSSGVTPFGARDFSLPPSVDLPLLRAEPFTTDQVYTLAELIDLAQMNNPQTRTAWDEARQAAASLGSARSAYLPSVSATVIGGYQRSGMNTALGSSMSSSTDMSANGTVSTASLSWLLFDFGGRDYKVASARNMLEGSNISFNGTHQKIIYDVSRQFFNYTSARQALKLTAKSRDETAFLLKASQARYDQGLGSKVEVERSKGQMAQADLDLVSAQGDERDAYHSLIKAVGITPMTVLRVQDVSGRPLPPSPPASVDRIVAEALRTRYDIQGGLASLRSARNDVLAAEADFFPKIFMSTSGSYTTGNLNITSLPSVPGSSGSITSSPSLNSRNVTVLGGASIPIYDGGMREESLKSARAKVDSAESKLIMLQQSAASDIVSAHDALRTSIASYQAAGVLVQASQTAKDSSFASYTSGQGSLTSAIDAEKSLQSARMSKEKAHGTALIAAASLAFAAGRLTSTDAVPGGWLPRSPL